MSGQNYIFYFNYYVKRVLVSYLTTKSSDYFDIKNVIFVRPYSVYVYSDSVYPLYCVDDNFNYLTLTGLTKMSPFYI